MNKKQKKMLWRIIVSAVLMVALHFVPVTGLIRFALYMVPYFIVGYDIQMCIRDRHSTRDPAESR